ncbi:MAG: MFS transporter [Proteobacteria bacterium]|nr:MFS transporter [Pseudomonadota bacterium]
MNITAGMILNRRNLFLLLASTMTVLAGATLAPALPGMKEAFGNHAGAEFWVKMILSAPGLVIAMSAPFAGRLVDRKSKKAILVASMILYGLTGVSGYFLSHSLVLILAGRLGLGIAVAGVMVATVTIAGEYFEGPEFGVFMGLQAGFSSIGGVVFLAFSGLLADVHWNIPFLIYAFAFLVLPGILIFLNDKNTITGVRPEPALDPVPARRSLYTCYILGFCEVFMLYMIPLHYPFYAGEFQSVSSSETGISMAVMLLIVALVSMNYHRYAKAARYQSLHALGFLVVGVGFAVMGLTANYAVAILGLMISGVGFGIVRPNLIVWLFSFTDPARRGRAMGGVTTSFFLAQFAAPILSQPVISMYGPGTTFAIMAGLSILLSFCLYLAPRWRPTETPQVA